MGFAELRNRMVAEQLLQRGISAERVLSAFRAVERHVFLPENLRASAYNDCPLPIGQNQTISQPYIVALMTQALDLTGEEKVLEIGTGSGYQAAILAQLCRKVYSIERIGLLAERAQATLHSLEITNVDIVVADGSLGLKEHAPYDAVLITAGAPRIPEILIEQLAESGKIVAPIGDTFSQTLTLLTKSREGIVTRELCGCVFVPLIGKYAWRE